MSIFASVNMDVCDCLSTDCVKEYVARAFVQILLYAIHPRFGREAC